MKEMPEKISYLMSLKAKGSMSDEILLDINPIKADKSGTLL